MKFIAVVIAVLPLAFAAGAGTFSYKPDSGKAPGAWASLDLGNKVNECGGAAQSGIDVPLGSCKVFGDYIFAAGSCTLDDIDFSINDHAIVATYVPSRNNCQVPKMTVPLDGKEVPYEVLQFHMHTGTDHALGGQYFGSCMHLVHREVGGTELSVLGFFFEPTDPDGIVKMGDLLNEWEKVPAATNAACSATSDVFLTPGDTAQQGGGGARRELSEQERRRLPRSFNPYDLIPSDATMYTYQGSLTTPPCSEIVFWNVIDTPVKISVREFLRMTNLIIDWVNPTTCEKASEAAPSGFTGRPVQNINGREITRVCPKGFDDPFAEVMAADMAGNSMTGTNEAGDGSESSAASVSFFAAIAAVVSAAALL